MRIFNKIPEELVFLKLDVEDKESLFARTAAFLKSYGYVEDEFSLLAGLNEREETMSTGIGQGLAIPHTDMGGARHFIVTIATLKKPIKFNSLDHKPVDVVFTLLVPKDRFDLLSGLLAALGRTLQKGDLLDRLRNAKTERDVLEELRASEDCAITH